MTAPYKVRPAAWSVAADREALLAVRFRVFVDEQQVPPAEEVDAHDPTATHLLASDATTGAPIGAARVVTNSGTTYRIGRMAVDQAWRGRGVGLALLDAALDVARRAGAAEAVLDAQTHAIPFYERRGFAAEGPEFLDAGIPHRLMRRTLTSATGEDVALQVAPEAAGQRLDSFLAAALPGAVSRSYAARLVAEGRVTTGDRAARKGEAVEAGARIVVHGFVRPEARALAPNPELAIHVVHEDADVVVLDKPPGLPSHPNRFDDDRTVVSFLLARYPEVRDTGDDPLRPGIAHRLDTDTSGLMVAARTPEAWRSLRAQFDAREVHKEYMALVLGVPREGAGEVALPVGHHPSDPRRMVVVTGPRVRTRGEPRAALTRYETIETFGDAFALLRVRTLTGRMHQVRVHLEAIGHPLAGDTLYLGPRRKKRDSSGLERHFLHAARLAFTHPRRGDRLDLRSALPPDLEAALARLRARRPPAG